mmetsp:Transcript_6012/g.13269  ORF Transcript_6012/g.13269 Transcript_6012/m.13269 type:complete len:316 (-) Transcript_6012:45-992(-)
MEAVRPALSGSVSLLHNNLQGAPSGWLAAVHNTASAGSGKILLHSLTNGSSRDGPDASQVTSVRYHTLPWGTVLCVCSTNGTKIYSEDCLSVHFYRQVNDPARPPDMVKNHQGSCHIPPLNQILIGSSKGALLVVQAPAPEQMAAVAEAPPMDPPPAEIADLCFSEATNAVVSAHCNGELRVWTCPTQSWENTRAIDGQGAQAPVRILPLGARLAIAYGPGTVRLYDAIAYVVQVEITAHARWLTAMSVREDLGQIATVGEDTALNVWQVDAASGQVSLAHSSVVVDKLLTGVTFTSAGVSITAYDSNELYNVMF